MVPYFRGPVCISTIKWLSSYIVLWLSMWILEADFLGANLGLGIYCVTLGKLLKLSVH